MTDENPAVEEPKVESPAEQKTFTQEEVDQIVTARLGRLKAEAINAAAEEIAEQKTAELKKKADEAEAKLNEALYENQLTKLSAKGVDVDLLRTTGLRGEALDTFAEKLRAATVMPEKKAVEDPKVEPKKGSAAAEAAIRRMIDGEPKRENDPKAWIKDLVANITKESK